MGSVNERQFWYYLTTLQCTEQQREDLEYRDFVANSISLFLIMYNSRKIIAVFIVSRLRYMWTIYHHDMDNE